MANTNTSTGRTYWLLCGNPDCVSRTEPRPDFAMPGWPVRDDELVDGELWVCLPCRGLDPPKVRDWVSWIVGGRFQRYRVDSPTGRAIVARLADLEAVSRRRCTVDGCDEPARPRSSTCSPGHARAVRRVRDHARNVRVSGSSAPALPETPERRTSDSPLPGATRTVIADTADISGLPERRCANCGCDISDRRADARFCKRDACRKALTRRARTIAGQTDLLELLGRPVVNVDTGDVL